VDATCLRFLSADLTILYNADYAAFGFRPGKYSGQCRWHRVAAVALIFFAEIFLLSFGIERRRWIHSAGGSPRLGNYPVQRPRFVESGLADPLPVTFGLLFIFHGFARGTRLARVSCCL